MSNSAEQAEFIKALEERSSSGALRGDYASADAEYEVAQNWGAYTPEQHGLWRRLFRRQASLLPGRAYDEFIDSLAKLNAADAIPQLDRISEALCKATGWRLAAVPGLVPDQTFFAHLASRRFPVTVWLREPHEFDYIVEPDVFHDFFGHVPLLFNRVFADHLQAYGKGGLKALGQGGLVFLARLYWYTIEFGLISGPQGLRAYGAGILSSGGEIDYCLTSPKPHRIAFNVERVMQTRYRIDAYQETYFVIRDFQQLFDDTAPDFTSLYERLHKLPALAPEELLVGEREMAVQIKRK